MRIVKHKESEEAVRCMIFMSMWEKSGAIKSSSTQKLVRTYQYSLSHINWSYLCPLYVQMCVHHIVSTCIHVLCALWDSNNIYLHTYATCLCEWYLSLTLKICAWIPIAFDTCNASFVPSSGCMLQFIHNCCIVYVGYLT